MALTYWQWIQRTTTTGKETVHAVTISNFLCTWLLILETDTGAAGECVDGGGEWCMLGEEREAHTEEPSGNRQKEGRRK